MMEKDLVKDQILDAASVVFRRFGYKKATMDDIGNAIKKGKTAVYYYFSSKEDIFKAVIEREAGQLEQSIIYSIGKFDNPLEKLKAYIEARMRTLQKVSNFYDAMKNELLDHLDFMNNVRKNYDIFEISLLKDILQDGVNKKIFNISNTEKVAELIVFSLRGMEIPIFLRPEVTDIDEKINDITQLFVYGLICIKDK